MKRRALSLSGVWAMEPSAFEQLREGLAKLSEPGQLDALSGKLGRLLSVADDVPLYEVIDGVAVIPFKGVVTRELSLWGWLFGGDACTTILTEAIQTAIADPQVGSILIDIDSPGGSVSGVAEAADVLFAARGAGKPVKAFAADLCASAAYWIGAQASALYVGRTAQVGSIGVFSTARDTSRLYKNEGIETTVVRSGRLKGAMTSGTHVGELELGELQRTVDAIAAEFVEDLARGRGLSTAEAQALATGRSWAGQAAVDGGLADGVKTLTDLITELRAEGAPLPQPGLLDPAPIPFNDTEAKASGNARTDVVAHAPAAKEAHMSDTNASVTLEGLAARQGSLETKIDQLLAGLTGKVTAVEATVTQITGAAELSALLAQARADVKLTPGNEAYIEPTIRAAFEQSPAAAKALVAALPALGKGEGSVLDGTARFSPAITAAQAQASAPSVRHRFDGFGREVWGASTDPGMKAFGRRIEWIEQAEAAGQKFNSAAEAFAAARNALKGAA